MYYHASPVGGIVRLEPRISNHGIPLIYFSRRRENVLVYLSNAIEKYCNENGFAHSGRYEKWGPYGFTKDGRQRLVEYYPNAMIDTYKGVAGYIYRVEKIRTSDFAIQIPDAAVSEEPVDISGVEFVPDAYEAILQAERDGLLVIVRYEEMPDRIREQNKKVIIREYENSSEHPEYRYFLRGNFCELLKDL